MLSEVIIILDRSGSMACVQDDTIGGFNSFLAEQKKVPGEARFTMVQFDELYEKVYQSVPIAEARNLTKASFVPRGSTALLDAIGRTIEFQGARFDAMPADKKPDKVIVAIITDGHENASHIYNRAHVFEMIQRQRDHWGWSIYFIGANQDAIVEAGNLGILRGQALSYAATSGGVRGMSAAMNNAVTASRNTGEDYSYTWQDQVGAMAESMPLDKTTSIGSWPTPTPEPATSPSPEPAPCDPCPSPDYIGAVDSSTCAPDSPSFDSSSCSTDTGGAE
jgi:uncharacterized protein YegL